MSDDNKTSDSDWLRLQRLESDRRAWLWARLKSAAGWVIGGPDGDVGGTGRADQTDRLGEAMTRVADWMYQHRWWPWVAIFLFLPGIVWPTAWWFEVEKVHIADSRAGEQVPMVLERRAAMYSGASFVPPVSPSAWGPP